MKSPIQLFFLHYTEPAELRHVVTEQNKTIYFFQNPPLDFSRTSYSFRVRQMTVVLEQAAVKIQPCTLKRDNSFKSLM